MGTASYCCSAVYHSRRRYHAVREMVQGGRRIAGSEIVFTRLRYRAFAVSRYDTRRSTNSEFAFAIRPNPSFV
jgi:hypothetical protein